MTTTDDTAPEPYTPDDEDVFIAYRFMSLGLMRDPDDKPHDPAATAEADAEYRRWLAAHDARVRNEGAREALDALAAQSRELTREMEPHDNGANAYTARAARLYRDIQYPSTVR